MALEPGTRLGPYEILSALGAGGMGEVYRARDGTLQRDVALKILPELFTLDPERLARFRREAQLLAALNHPNIAAIYGFEESTSVQALVLELVEGPTLEDRIAHGPVPLDEALPIARQIAEAFDIAHEKGIVHRDLKPGNIKLTPDGTVKVLDFGLAKAAGESLSPDLTHSPTVALACTRDGVILGTAAYMSPEQARGKVVDKRADIWAFGCVVYEMLTGRPACGGETMSDTLVAILEREPDWTALPPSTPPGLRRLLRRCLEKDVKRRMRDIGDARAELEDAAAQPLPIHDSGPRRRFPRWGAASAVVGAALCAGIVMWEARRPSEAVLENPLASAQFTQFTDFSGTEHAAAISPDGRFVAFLSDRDGKFDIWLSQVGTGRFLNLTPTMPDQLQLAVRTVGFTGDGSQIWIAGNVGGGRMQVMPLIGGMPRAFLGETVINAAWSSDGSRMIYHTRDAGDPMFVADGSGRNPRQIFVSERPDIHNHFPAWSTDGRWIYFVRGLFSALESDIWRISPDGGQPERLTQHNGDVAYVAPIDPRTVLYVARAEDRSGPWLWAVDIETKVTRRVSLGLEQYTSVSASADGRRVVATVANPIANLWSVPILGRLAEERDANAYPLPTVRALAPRFGGTSLFYLSSQGTGDGVWRFRDGQALEIWKGADGALLEPAAVAPDGSRVAVVLRRQRKLRLLIVEADGADSRELPDTIDVRGSAEWSPDGQWIVTGGSDAKGPGLFKIPIDGGAPVRLVTGAAFNPVWSPDGTLIVYAGQNIALHAPILAVTADGAPVELPPLLARNGGERFRFLPDGRGVVYMQGFGPSQDFWLLDLTTKRTRQLTRLANQGATRTFDVTPDGTQIVFDRLRENSDVALINLPR